MDRMGRVVGRLGGKLGIAVCLLGFVVIYLGWNGAGSFNDLRQQFPYLISGGVAGLGLVMVGCSLLLVESMRAERAELQATLLELRDALEAGSVVGAPAAARTATAPLLLGGDADGLVVAGTTSFHRPSCRLVEQRDDLEVIDADEATARGLAPCRICDPTPSPNGTSRRVLRAD